MKKLLYLALIPLFFSACTKQSSIQVTPKTLQEKIQSISQTIDKQEAKDLSFKTYSFAKELKQTYELVSPPLYHNFLVNAGIKKRGLCWHFAFDLLLHVKKQNYRSFDYYIVGANIDDYWQEHNALLITCQGCEAQKGVIIDLWRNSGEPFFVGFKEDSVYSWSVRGGKR